MDDPTNVPRLGRWSKAMRLAGLTIDDQAIDRTELPFKLPVDMADGTICTEPRLKTLDEVNETMPGGKLDCRLVALDKAGNGFTGAGRCTMPARGAMRTDGTIRLGGEQNADDARLLGVLSLQIHAPEGQTHEVRTSYVTEWKRVGECR